MLFKVFYQENKNATPRRENTKTMYIDLKVKSADEGVIALRELIGEKTNYRIEYIDALTDDEAAYEKETTEFELTEF